MPVTNFEPETQPLTEKEKLLIQPTINAFRNTANRKDNLLMSSKMMKAIEQEYNKMTGETVWIRESLTLRKLVGYLVNNRILPIASSNAGYWLCGDEDFDDQVRSLKERANSINTRAESMLLMKYGNYKANEKPDDEF